MDITIRIEAPELASSLKALAEAIGWAASAKPDLAAKFAPQPTETPVIIPEATKPEPTMVQPELEGTPAPIRTITFEQLQAKAAELVRSGNRDKVKTVMDKFGVTKVSQIPDDQRADAMTALEAS